MTGSMTGGGYAHHRAIAEDIVLAVDGFHLVPMVIVVRIVKDAFDQRGVVAGLPLAPLNEQSGIGQLIVAAAVVEMEMRVDDEIDLRGRHAERLEPSRDLLAGFESNSVIRGEPSEAAIRIGLRLAMEAAVEDRASFRMLDQIRG